MKTVNLIYSLLKNILFRFDPEKVHNLAIKSFRRMADIDILMDAVSNIFKCETPFDYLGMRFRNPLGLAAGFDKNAEVFDFIDALGFGFCEVGSVSFKPQKGNPPPRIFRIPDEFAIINSIGLENLGAYDVARNIEKKKHKIKIPLGVNVVKNNDVDFKDSAVNVSQCLRVFKDLGDFFVFNMSCPNVKGFDGDIKSYLRKVFDSIASIDIKKPVFLKISPDLEDDQIRDSVITCVEYGYGIVATNTTRRRDLIKTRSFDEFEGGLSGKPLAGLSVDVIDKIRRYSSSIDIIACGGISDEIDIKKRQKYGVKLFEIYTSFIYRGPGIVKEICRRF